MLSSADMTFSRVKCIKCDTWKDIKRIARVLLSGGICKKCDRGDD